MPRTAEQNEEIRKEKKQVILDAALKLFAEKGYAATSTNDIIKEANISKGLLYNYFESKEELLKTVVVNFANEMDEMLAPAHDNVMSKEDALQFFDKFFDMLMTRTKEAKLFTQLTCQPEVLTLVSDSSILSKMSKRGEAIYLYLAENHKENVEMVLMNFEAILNGITTLYVFSPTEFSNEGMLQYRDYLKNMFIGRS